MQLLHGYLIACATVALCRGLQELPAAATVSDQACVDHVSTGKQAAAVVSAAALGALVRKGLYACAKAVVQKTPPGQLALEYQKAFETEQRHINNEMASLKSAIESALPRKSVSPAFQWAQSTTELLLNVKFSHKIDAPATLNVEAKTVNITENKLLLEATDGRKLFRLEIDFHGLVVPDDSTWSMASVGRMTFAIKKHGAPVKWPSLTRGGKKLPQMHWWMDMQEKYAAELAKLEDDEAEAKKAPAADAAAAAAGATGSDAADAAKAAEGDAKPADTANPDAGRIVSEEELARRAEVKRIDDEHKKQVSELEDEARKRKKEIDTNSKEQKASIDNDVATRRAEVDKIYMEKKAKFSKGDEL